MLHGIFRIRLGKAKDAIYNIWFRFLLISYFVLVYCIIHRRLPIYRVDKAISNFTALEGITEMEYPSATRPSRQLRKLNSTFVHDQRVLCPSKPPRLKGRLHMENMFQDRPWSEIEAQHFDLSHGGSYAPTTCVPRNKVAIIIPLRNRETQLRTLLAHMHPVWKRQEIAYKVFVISQTYDAPIFNRAKLLNAGVAEARKDGVYDCYVFQDVDLLVEDDRCLYWCHEPNPRLVSMHVDKFSYKPLSYTAICRDYAEALTPYKKILEWGFGGRNLTYFGGVSMLTSSQFDEMNGLSNIYWGWGGEDDDLYLRLEALGYSVDNPYGTECSFRMIPHRHESSNAVNEGRHSLLRYASWRMMDEGYSTLQYKMLSYQEKSLYTNITVDVGQPSRKMVEFMSESTKSSYKCYLAVPWEMVSVTGNHKKG